MAIGHLITNLIPNGMCLPILTGPLAGSKWIAGAAAGGGKGMSVLLNRAETNQLRSALKVLTPQSVCLDVGANVGLYTLLFSKYGKNVHSFEPSTRNLAYLYRLVEINRLKNVTLLPWAVSSNFAMATFSSGQNCALGKLSAGGDLPVITATLDQYVSRYNLKPDVLKIDVEGAEAEVIQGAREFLSEIHPTIFLSTHGKIVREECLARLKELGYLINPLSQTANDLGSEFEITFAQRSSK